MNLQELCDLQGEFDRRHGWGLDAIPPDSRMEILEQQVIGLVGEVGELANLVKKARLRAGRKTTLAAAFEEISADATEELTDSLIYLIRLFRLFGVDIESSYCKKMAHNASRYKEYVDDSSV